MPLRNRQHTPSSLSSNDQQTNNPMGAQSSDSSQQQQQPFVKQLIPGSNQQWGQQSYNNNNNYQQQSQQPLNGAISNLIAGIPANQFNNNPNNAGQFNSNLNNAGQFNNNPNNAGQFNINPNNAGQFNGNSNNPVRFNENPNNAGQFNSNINNTGQFNNNPNNAGQFNNNPNNAGQFNSNLNNGPFDNQRFQQVVQKYEINREFAKKMELVNGFETVFIFDDSGSMNSELNDSPLNAPGSYQRPTRWDELQAFATISVDILSIFDTNGCDIHFLNRPPMRNVKNYQQILQLFQQKPAGYTPLTRTLQTVLNENRNVLQQKNLLVVIVTDGEPTDDQGYIKINEFSQTLASRQPIDRIFVSIVACTDDFDSISYLNNMDKMIPKLDVVDDYRNEKSEVKAKFGPQYPFSYGDYVVKSLVGSIDPELDAMDGF
jgi:hypothetical protein